MAQPAEDVMAVSSSSTSTPPDGSATVPLPTLPESAGGGTPTPQKPAQCTMCGKPFPSRAAVFRHLRDESSECGREVAAQGGIGHGEFLPSNNAIRREVLAGRSSGSKRAKKDSGGSGGIAHSSFARRAQQVGAQASLLFVVTVVLLMQKHHCCCAHTRLGL